MKCISLMLTVIWFITTANGQNIVLNVSSGYNLYSMDKQKEIQSSALQGIRTKGIPAEIVESFPSFFNYRIELAWKDFQKTNIGFFYEIASTGGRIDFADYSGEYAYDQIISKHGIGLSVEDYMYDIGPLNGGLNLRLHYVASEFVMKEDIALRNFNQITKYEFNTDYTFAIEPGAFIEYATGVMLFRFGTSFMIQYPTKFYLGSNDKAVLKFKNDDVKPQWDALRIECSIGVQLSRLLNSTEEK